MTALESDLARVTVTPGDADVVRALAEDLGTLDAEARARAFEQARHALAGEAQSLAEFGTALCQQSFDGCESMGARVLVDALETDPRLDDAVETLVRNVARIKGEDAEAIVERALDETERDPRLLLVKATLRREDDDALARQLQSEAVEALLTRVGTNPDEANALVYLAPALGELDGKDRERAVARARQALSGRAALLASFGEALCEQSFPGSERLGERILLDALEADPHRDGVVEALVSAVDALAQEDAARLVDRALELTGRDRRVLLAKARLVDDPQRARDLRAEAIDSALACLQTSPDNPSAVDTFMVALAASEPEDRERLSEHARATLAGRADALAALGAALVRWGRAHVLWPHRRASPTGLQWFRARQIHGAHVLLDALEVDPHVDGAIDPLVDALEYLPRDDAEPIVERALAITARDPRLLVVMAALVDDEEHAGQLRLEAIEGLLARLEASPDDAGIPGLLASTLAAVAATPREPAVERARAAVMDHPVAQVALGNALVTQSFASCERLGAIILLDALETDPQPEAALDALLTALAYLDREDDELIVARAVALTDHDPRVLLRWGQRLVSLDEYSLGEQYLLDALRRDQAHSATAITAPVDRYLARRLYTRAMRWLDRAEAVCGAIAPVLYQRGLVLAGRALQHRAIRVFEQALAAPDLDVSMRVDLHDSLLAAHRDLAHQAEIAALLESLEPDVCRHWDSPERGRYQLALWRAQCALSFRDSAEGHRRLKVVEELEDGLNEDPDARRRCALALVALEGRPASLRDLPGQVTDLRIGASFLRDASARLPLRQEAIRRAKAEGEPDAATLAELYFELGLELDALGRTDKAAAAYERAHQLWEHPVEEQGCWLYGPYAMHNVAVLQESAGRYEDAMRTWRATAAEYETIATNDPYLAWARSSVLLRLDQIEAAYEACLHGLAEDDESIDLLLQLVDLDKEWQSSCRRRLRGDTAPPPDSEALGESLRWRGRDALRKVSLALRERAAASDDARHQREYARFLLDRPDHQAPRVYIEKAMQLEPDEAENYRLLARWFEREGRKSQALEAYSTALELEPGDIATRSALGGLRASLGDKETGKLELARVHDDAPAHVETLLRLADIYTDLGDESDDSAYGRAIALYDTALHHHRLGSGSKFLSTSETASLLYQRGYCRVKLYEATPNARRGRQLLGAAVKDFDECLLTDPSHDKARAAKSKLTARGTQLLLSWREQFAPWIVFLCAMFVFALAQVRYLSGHLTDAAHVTLTLGGIGLIIAGLALPELLKLKVGGLELEKSSVEQQHGPASFNLSR